MSAVALVLPEFALIVLGVLLRRWGWRSAEFWTQLERLVYYVLFPVLLFRTTLAADLGASGAGGVLAAGVGATLAGALLAAVVRWLPHADPTTAASGWQTAFRFNSFIALALVDGQGTAAVALMGVLLGINVPLVNVLAVTALARSTTDGQGGRRGSGALRSIAANPLILSTAAGLLGNVAGLTLPTPVDSPLARLGGAAVPLGLLAVGAALHAGGVARGRRLMAAHLGLVKLVAVPAVALGVGSLLGVDDQQLGVLLAFAAVPPATSSYVLASRMGGDGPFVATLTTLATAAALITLPIWLTIGGVSS